MRRSIALLATLVASFFVTSAYGINDCSSEVAALRALYELRQMMFHPGVSSYSLSSRADDYIEELRDPLPGGGYRWVRYVRPSGEGPVTKREHSVATEYGEDSFDTFEASANHPYAVRVVVPRKRSLMKANKEVWVGDVEIRYWVDGEEERMTKSIGQWMSPDTSRTFDLGVIADRAEATVESSARDAKKKESLVEIHFRQAVAEDNPDNPGYEAIRSLQRLAGSSFDPVTMDYEIARFERRLFGAPTSAPLAMLFGKIQQAEKLLASEKPEDQEKGRKLLGEATKGMQTPAQARD